MFDELFTNIYNMDDLELKLEEDNFKSLDNETINRFINYFYSYSEKECLKYIFIIKIAGYIEYNKIVSIISKELREKIESKLNVENSRDIYGDIDDDSEIISNKFLNSFLYTEFLISENLELNSENFLKAYQKVDSLNKELSLNIFNLIPFLNEFRIIELLPNIDRDDFLIFLKMLPNSEKELLYSLIDENEVKALKKSLKKLKATEEEKIEVIKYIRNLLEHSNNLYSQAEIDIALEVIPEGENEPIEPEKTLVKRVGEEFENRNILLIYDRVSEFYNKEDKSQYIKNIYKFDINNIYYLNNKILDIFVRVVPKSLIIKKIKETRDRKVKKKLLSLKTFIIDRENKN